MNAPRRWLESGDASPDALDLLGAGRAPLPLDAATRQRSKRRVAALGALPLAALLVSWPQLALGAVVGTLGTFAVMSAAQRWVSPEPPVVLTAPRSAPRPVTPPPLEAAPRSAPPEAVEAPLVAKPAPRRATSSASEGAPAPGDTLKQETLLLEQARRKLALEPHGALKALREHEQAFPNSRLRIERELLLIDALIRLGRRAEAEARGKALEQQAPQTLYRERLQRLLAP